MKFDAHDFPPEVIDSLAERIADRLAQRLTPPPTPDEVFDTVHAAAYLKLSKQQLEIWRCKGGGPKFSKLDRRVRYRRTDLDEFLAAGLRSHTGEAR